ncbi:unnamed protein product [Symbiodinium natans]|uniref:Uncharacterized protein n=1 Tax=Symbiodinium natans TaxID=878477 RepID=A0A812PL50_9DINO|nr:unnamed protein product [Symbiodinium natans]
MQPPPYGAPPPPPPHYAPQGHAYGHDPYGRPEFHGSQPGYYAGPGYSQYDYRQQSTYGERNVEYGSGFNEGHREGRPRDHGSKGNLGDWFEGHAGDRRDHQGDWDGRDRRGGERGDRPERGERDRDRRDRERRDRDDPYHPEDYSTDRAGYATARDDDRRESDHRRGGHEGRGDPRPAKGGGKGGRGRGGGGGGGGGGGQGSRELAQSRSRSRRRSSSGSSSGASQQEKKRMRKAAGFDCVTKPRQQGKVPTEAAPQRGLAVAPGRKADVHGLKGASQYNGCEGIVIEGPNDKGRWEVQVDYQCETKTSAPW